MLRPSNYSPHDPEPGLDGILSLRPASLTSTEIERVKGLSLQLHMACSR